MVRVHIMLYKYANFFKLLNSAPLLTLRICNPLFKEIPLSELSDFRQ